MVRTLAHYVRGEVAMVHCAGWIQGVPLLIKLDRFEGTTNPIFFLPKNLVLYGLFGSSKLTKRSD
jgi:hypothetical protein